MNNFLSVFDTISNLQSMLYLAECNRMGLVDDDAYRKYLLDIKPAFENKASFCDMAQSKIDPSP